MDDDWASSGGAGGGFFTAEEAPLDQADMGRLAWVDDSGSSSELRRARAYACAQHTISIVGTQQRLPGT